MMLRSKSWVLIVAGLMALGPACAKKNADDVSGGSSTKKVQDDDGGDENTDSENLEAEGGDTDACLIDDCGEEEGKGEAEGLDPESEFYEETFAPPEMKPCNESGKVYLRCSSTCTDVDYPAKFKCDRAGIEAQFSTVEGFSDHFKEFVDDKKYFIDQCGVTAAKKPFVVLSCFTKGDGVCAEKEDIDTKSAEVLSDVITTDANYADACPSAP